MSGILSDLKTYHELYNIVSVDDLNYLFTAISDAKIYIKVVHRHQIEKHSSIKVRLQLVRSGYFYQSLQTFQYYFSLIV